VPWKEIEYNRIINMELRNKRRKKDGQNNNTGIGNKCR
jgi:hypothetical protein